MNLELERGDGSLVTPMALTYSVYLIWKFILFETVQGTSAETHGLDDVFRPDALVVAWAPFY